MKVCLRDRVEAGELAIELGLAEPGGPRLHLRDCRGNDHGFDDDAPAAAAVPRFPLPPPRSDRAASGGVVLDHGLCGHLPNRAAVGSDPR